MENIGKITSKERTIKLDLKNKKILSLLMADARINLSEISKKVELSKSNVSRRISQMEESELITGYHAFIDVSKIGINSTLVLLKTKATQYDKEKYIQRIANLKKVYSLVEIIGDFDIALGIYSKSLEEKNKILDEVLKDSHIKDFEICEVKTKFPKMNYTEKMFTESFEKKKSEKETTITDDKDLKILSALSKNCRISSVNLSEKLNLPRVTINYRIKNLIESGVIAKFQPTVNFFMLETEFYFLRFKLLKPSGKDKIEAYLSETSRANTILESEGTYQVMAFLQFKNNSEFREFEEKFLAKFKDILHDYSFNLAKSQHKLDWFPQ